MKPLEKLSAIFLKIDNARNPSEIEALSNEVDIILKENNEQPIEGVADLLLERAKLLKQKITLMSHDFEAKLVQ
ncbi:hypothetical protein VB264_02145 [Arcicella aquatica]|uniref:Uncharacterized protein n=1 Tax=Arcicella aquatica TaxID=217141 RepID=A0ABU5QHZ9_9BACT|nr:hypothetical protein [Arcicella aquatica]MEA5256565.1 hypothetical protein [Arcicella aquatica]